MTAAIMAGWKDEYLAQLRIAEKNNPVNMEIVNACNNPTTYLALSRHPYGPVSSAVVPY